MKTIPLTQGKVALVDDEDFEYLSQFHWYAKRVLTSRHGLFYAVACKPGGTRKNRTLLRMHRLLLDAPIIDHINGNGLDNQRHNLRSVTHAQNTTNSRRHYDNVSGYKGVARSINGKWQARICGKSLGLFASPIDAARAYDAAALIRFGEFARPNFPMAEWLNG